MTDDAEPIVPQWDPVIWDDLDDEPYDGPSLDEAIAKLRESLGRPDGATGAA